MKRVLVDTSAFFAHLVTEDRHHARSHALFERSAVEGWTLVTTNAVVWETYTLIRKRARASRELALGFLEVIGEGLCQVEWVGRADEALAIELLRRHSDKEYSFCDALSFIVADRLGVVDAMAFDRDFETYGRFNLL